MSLTFAVSIIKFLYSATMVDIFMAIFDSTLLANRLHTTPFIVCFMMCVFLFFSFQWLLNLSHWIPIQPNSIHEIISLLMVSFWHFPKHLYVNCETKWQNRKERFCITNSPDNNDTVNKVNTLYISSFNWVE